MVIRIQDAEKHYQLEKAEIPALTGINLVIGRGACLPHGSSGSGKSHAPRMSSGARTRSPRGASRSPAGKRAL